MLLLNPIDYGKTYSYFMCTKFYLDPCRLTKYEYMYYINTKYLQISTSFDIRGLIFDDKTK